MPRIMVCYPENMTLPGGQNHTRHIKSQSFKIADDKAIIIEWLIDEMGQLLS